MTDAITIDTFRPLLHGAFTIHAGDAGTQRAELAEVRSVGEAPDGGREPFALLFRAAEADGVLPQATYRLENDQLGELEVFIVPVAAQDGAVDYEAIFT